MKVLVIGANGNTATRVIKRLAKGTVIDDDVLRQLAGEAVAVVTDTTP